MSSEKPPAQPKRPTPPNIDDPSFPEELDLESREPVQRALDALMKSKMKPPEPKT